MIKKILGIAGIVLIVILAILVNLFLIQPIEVEESKNFPTSPIFKEIPINFNHRFTAEDNSKPFLGGAIIDINGDSRQEIFIGGGYQQDDALFSFMDGEFINIINGTGLSNPSATYGAVSIDLDHDKDIDLIVARNDGVYVYENEDSKFLSKKLNLTLPQEQVVIGVSAGDFNKDNYPDLYLNTFIRPKYFKPATFNDPSNAAQDILLINDQGKFIDATEESMAVVKQNSFTAVFVDLNNDSWQDLVVATNTGTVRIFKNVGGKFVVKKDPTGYGFWMGLGVGDLNNDGYQDLVLTNSGNTIKSIFAKGDLRNYQLLDTKWAVLFNNGDFTFERKNDLPNLGFSWGIVAEDLNLDGKEDILLSQNYIKWLAHRFKKLPGRLFIQDNGNFVAATELSGLSNPYYGQSPLLVDINNDGYQDVLLLNINGPLRAFLNNGGENHYLKVILEDSAESLGAILTLTKKDGSKLTKQYFTSEGYMTDPSPEIIFGLGQEEPESLTIKWPSGRDKTVDNLEVDSVVVVG